MAGGRCVIGGLPSWRMGGLTIGRHTGVSRQIRGHGMGVQRQSEMRLRDLVRGTGIEPVTPSVSRRCSTTEPTARVGGRICVLCEGRKQFQASGWIPRIASDETTLGAATGRRSFWIVASQLATPEGWAAR